MTALPAARGYIDRERLRQGFSHLIIGDEVLEKLGPAVNAGKAVFLYGPPGNGKTVIAEGMGRTLGGDMYMPHAIDVDGHDHHDVRSDQPRLARGRDGGHVERHRRGAARSAVGAHPPAGRHGAAAS